MKLTVGECVKAYGEEPEIGCLRKLLKYEMSVAKALEYEPLQEDIKKVVDKFTAAKRKRASELGDDKGGGLYFIKRENVPQFNNELEEAKSKTVEISDIKINLDELPNATISPDDLPLLKKFVVFGEAKENKEEENTKKKK